MVKKKEINPTRAVSLIKKMGGSKELLASFEKHIDNTTFNPKQKIFLKAYIENNCSKRATFMALDWEYSDLYNKTGKHSVRLEQLLTNIRKRILEDKAFEMALSGDGNPIMLMFLMKNIFPEQYKADNERQAVNIDNRKQNFTFIKNEFSDLSNDNLIKKIDELREEVKPKENIIDCKKIEKDK